MKNKLVVWGTNEQNEKVLIALELQPDTNKVLLYTFPESVASDEFVNKMMNEWRTGSELAFPEGYTQTERELSVVESLLPDDLKVERGDLIHRAQTEWQFAVLSAKLHQAYQNELAEFKEKVQGLQAYDHTLWESLRAFWDKVQGQSRDRNLFREHADHLRDNINALFDDLKKMRSKVQDEFMSTSSKVYDEFSKALDDIETRIAAGGNKLNSVFEDLKQMQRRYRDARMSNEHRNTLWERLDGAFKAAKERKFGPSANEGSVVERHSRRLEGLNEAIRRMEDSIKRDEDELNFQRRKIDASEGQLEAQIRTAKIKMIEERVGSKREKLNEMNQTRNEVERQAQIAKGKETKRAEKEADRQRIEAARETAKSEIAAAMREKRASAPPPAMAAEPSPDYSAAAAPQAEFTGSDLMAESQEFLAGLSEPVQEYTEPVESIEPVVSMTEPGAEFSELTETDEDDSEPVEPAILAEEMPQKESMFGAIGNVLGEALEDAVVTVRAVASVVADHAGDMLESAKEKGEAMVENVFRKENDAPAHHNEPVAGEMATSNGTTAEEQFAERNDPAAHISEPAAAETETASSHGITAEGQFGEENDASAHLSEPVAAETDSASSHSITAEGQFGEENDASAHLSEPVVSETDIASSHDITSEGQFGEENDASSHDSESVGTETGNSSRINDEDKRDV